MFINEAETVISKQKCLVQKGKNVVFLALFITQNELF